MVSIFSNFLIIKVKLILKTNSYKENSNTNYIKKNAPNCMLPYTYVCMYTLEKNNNQNDKTETIKI